MNEIIKADPVHRNLVIVLIVLALAAMLAVALWGGPWFNRYIQEMVDLDRMDDLRQSLIWLESGLMVFMTGFGAFGAWFVWMGRKTIRERKFPPTGVKVIRDTVQVVEDEAVRRGRVVVGLGAVLIITAMFADFMVIMLFQNLFLMMK